MVNTLKQLPLQLLLWYHRMLKKVFLALGKKQTVLNDYKPNHPWPQFVIDRKEYRICLVPGFVYSA